jgi:hypothetical protein
MNFKINNEILLILFITTFMFLGAGKIFDHTIVHNSPEGFMASDAFTHNWLTQNYFDNGYINQPPLYGFNNEVEYQNNINNFKTFHPTILPNIVVSISKLSKINLFNINIITVFFFVILIIIFNFYILSKFNYLLALLSLPFTLLFLQRKFLISLTWGWWDFLTGEFFLFSVILLMFLKVFNKRFFLLAFLISAAFMAHGVEAGYSALFILFFLISNLLFNKNIIKTLIFEQFKAILITIVLCLYPLMIMLKTWAKIGGSQVMFMSFSKFISTHNSNYFIYFNEFINFRIIILLGCLLLLYLMLQKKISILPYYCFVIFMSLTPYLYFTAGERSFQWRFLWPIYLSFAFGTFCLMMYNLVYKFLNNKSISKLISFFSVLLILILIVTPLPFIKSNILDNLDFDSYKWIHKNTDPHSKFLIMYSPLNSQVTRLLLLKRDIYVSRIETLQNMKIKDSKFIKLNRIFYNGAFFCYKKDCSFFQKSDYLSWVAKRKEYHLKNESICNFDYVYLTYKNQKDINDFNSFYIQNLINKNITKIVFNNQNVIISKNLIKGEECEERIRN